VTRLRLLPCHPSTDDLVAQWIDAKRAAGNQYSTIRRRLSSLKALYKQKRLRDPRKDPAIAAAWERVVTQVRRREDKPLAVTETGVRRMLHKMDGEFGALALPDPRTKLSFLRDRSIGVRIVPAVDSAVEATYRV
jgi:hypothetical protein